MTSSQLSELESFWNIEGGWGDWKQDYRIAQLTAISAEPHRDKKRKAKPYTAEDFVLRPKEAKTRGTRDERVRRMRKSLDMMAQQGKKK